MNATKVRLLYTDLVRRRSRVRVVQATEEANAVSPIFLIGLYRSGTTLLRYVVDSHTRIGCPPESDFLTHLGPMLEDERAMAGLDSLGFDRRHVLTRVRAFAEYFFVNYAASQGKPRWADKSPAYVDHLDLLRTLFPDATYVMIHRHPLDQIHSFTRGGTNARPPLLGFLLPGEDMRLAAARYWVEKTALIQQFSLEDSAVLHIRYEDVCGDPETTLRRVFRHVGETWEDEVLRYDQHEHDHGMEAAKTRAARGFELRSHAWQTWPDAVVDACWGIVATQAASVGYASPQARIARASA